MQVEIASEKTSLKKRFKAFFKSKFAVIATLILTTLGLFGGIAKTSADSIDLSGVYQYFLLDNQNGYNSDDKKAKHDIKHPTGALGSGGNHGRFNYTQIVEGAGKDNRASAKQFSSEMATLSGYHYFNVTNEGFSGIFNSAGTFLEGLVLIPFGMIDDLSNVIYHIFSNVIVKYNVFTMLGNAFGNTGVASGLADALGISKSFLDSIVSLATAFFAIILIIGIIKALSHEDAFSMSHWKKNLQRIVGFLAMPVVVTFCSMLISDLTADSTTVGKQNPDFANYIINVQTWAKDNFNMNVGGAKGISSSTKDGTYLDSSWNPYADNGKKASQIGQALFQEGPLSGTAFPNTALAVQLMSNKTFTAEDYLSYIESTDNANGVKTALKGFGKNYGNLYDYKNAYTSMGTKEDNWDISDSPFVKAKDDYGDAKNPTTGPVQAWVERYIYGAKSTGDLKDYYGANPSMEQVYADFGGNSSSGQRLSDASTFLALNTKFDVEGGTFSINNPAQGIKGTVASFAYQTPVWSSYALVGSALYTLPKMIGSAIFTLIVLAAILIAILRVGLIEMNVDPLRAWFKSIFKGDIEYTYASVVYAVGVLGTVILMSYVGPVLSGAFNKIINTLFGPLTQNITFNSSGTPSVGGTELIGLSGIITFAIAIIALRFFVKDEKFREMLVEVLTLSWTWASATGHKLEAQADGNLMSEAKNRINNRANLNKKVGQGLKNGCESFKNHLDSLAKGDSRRSRLANKMTGGLAGKVARGINAAKDFANPNSDVDTTGGLSKAEALKREMRTDGAKQRLENAMAMIPSDKKIEKGIDGALNKLEDDANKFEPDEDGMLNPEDIRLTDEQQEEAQDINDEQEKLNDEQEGLDQEQAELDADQAQIDRERAELERQHNAGEISDEEYERRKKELDARQAEHDGLQAQHDAKQADHDMRQDLLNDKRNDLMDAVNGTASLDHEGKFNLDNPNLTDEERQEASELNDEQDKINAENQEIAEEQESNDQAQAAIDADQAALDKRKAEFKKNASNMTPEERQKERKEIADEQREINKRQEAVNARQSELDNKKAANEERQTQLSAKQNALMDKVNSENNGQTVSTAQRNAHKKTATGLAEQARINATAYQKTPNAKNAAAVIESLQAMKDEAEKMNVSTQKLYGIDVDKQIQSIQKATPLPAQSGQQMMRVDENPNGSYTVTTMGNSTNSSVGGSSRINTKSKAVSADKMYNSSYNNGKESLRSNGSSYQRSQQRTASLSSTKRPQSNLTSRSKSSLTSHSNVSQHNSSRLSLRNSNINRKK